MSLIFNLWKLSFWRWKI